MIGGLETNLESEDSAEGATICMAAGPRKVTNECRTKASAFVRIVDVRKVWH